MVANYARVRREAQRDGHSTRQLKSLDAIHCLRIDIAYTRYKDAENLERVLSQALPANDSELWSGH
jgi:CHAD domain-containing protein